jgi:hypothetical protein
MNSFHLKYGCQPIQTTVPITARNELQNHAHAARDILELFCPLNYENGTIILKVFGFPHSIVAEGNNG